MGGIWARWYTDVGSSPIFSVMLPAMPAFYTQPDTLDDAVSFVAAKVLDLVGVEHDLLRRWGSG